MDSGPSVAAGTRARCTKLPGVCVFWKLRLEEVVTGGSEVHAGRRRTWAMQGSALPALWQHPLRVYHSLSHQPNFQLPGGTRGLSGSWKPLCQCSRQAGNARERCLPGAVLYLWWVGVGEWLSQLSPLGWALRCRPHSHSRVLAAEAHGSQCFLFFPVLLLHFYPHLWDHPLKSTCTQILIPGSASGRTQIKVLTVCRIAHTY